MSKQNKLEDVNALASMSDIGINIKSGSVQNEPTDVTIWKDDGWYDVDKYYIKETSQYTLTWARDIEVWASKNAPTSPSLDDLWFEYTHMPESKLRSPVSYVNGNVTDIDVVREGDLVAVNYTEDMTTIGLNVKYIDTADIVDDDGEEDGTFLVRKELSVPFWASTAPPIGAVDGELWFSVHGAYSRRINTDIKYSPFEPLSWRNGDMYVKAPNLFTVEVPELNIVEVLDDADGKEDGTFSVILDRSPVFISNVAPVDMVNGEIWMQSTGVVNTRTNYNMNISKGEISDGDGTDGDLSLAYSSMDGNVPLAEIRIVDEVPLNDDFMPNGTIIIIK